MYFCEQVVCNCSRKNREHRPVTRGFPTMYEGQWHYYPVEVMCVEEHSISIFLGSSAGRRHDNQDPNRQRQESYRTANQCSHTIRRARVSSLAFSVKGNDNQFASKHSNPRTTGLSVLVFSPVQVVRDSESTKSCFGIELPYVLPAREKCAIVCMMDQ